MARPRKVTSIDDAILAQEQAVAKAKAKYDDEVKKLKDLHAKKNEIQRKALLEAVEKSGHTYEEIMAFLREDAGTE